METLCRFQTNPDGQIKTAQSGPPADVEGVFSANHPNYLPQHIALCVLRGLAASREL
jgi:hypothetical protein